MLTAILVACLLVSICVNAWLWCRASRAMQERDWWSDALVKHARENNKLRAELYQARMHNEATK